MLSPFEGGYFKVTSPYGMRVLNGEEQFHGGVDVVGLSSKNVCAIASGKVVTSRIVTDKDNLTWQWGNYVCILAEDNTFHYYCHLKERKVEKGQYVNKGDIIGVEGNTGYSFGSHLHLEIREEDNTKINAAEYIGIPNEVGTYEMPDEEEIYQGLVKTCSEIYHKVEDVPLWAKPTIKGLVARGILKGDTNGDLKLSEQMIRLLVMIDRSGVFG